MATNLTNLTNANTIVDMLPYVSYTTEGYLGLMIILSISIISFLALKRYDTKSAFVGSSIICLVLGGILLLLEILNFRIYLVIVFITIIAIASTFFDNV